MNELQSKPRFKLKRVIPAISRDNGETKFIQIPAGSIIIVEDGPLDGDRLLDVRWAERLLMVFTADVMEHGDEQSPIPGTLG